MARTELGDELSNKDFRGKDFRNKSFENISLDWSDFRGVDLSGSTFINCTFRECKFDRAILENTKFVKCNFREDSFEGAQARNVTFEDCMLLHCSFKAATLSQSRFLNCDARKVCFRYTLLQNVDFKDTRVVGINTRQTIGVESCKNLPSFMSDTMLAYKLTPPDTVNTAFKLTQEDYSGIYRPGVIYKEGFELIEEEIDPVTNPGMAVATLNWILREWVMLGANPRWHLFKIEFRTEDIVDGDNGGKFNVKRIKVLEEVDLQQFYDQIIRP